MWRTSAYIDINAWKAGIAERPEDRRWCSFAAAVRGDRKARTGYAFMYGGGEWRMIRECHEQSMQEAIGEVLKARAAEKEECRAGRGASSFRSKADPRLDISDKVRTGLGKESERTAKYVNRTLLPHLRLPRAMH